MQSIVVFLAAVCLLLHSPVRSWQVTKYSSFHSHARSCLHMSSGRSPLFTKADTKSNFDLSSTLNPSEQDMWGTDSSPALNSAAGGDNPPVDEVVRSEIPSRFDSALLLVSGVVGFEPKEVSFKNGHSLQSFSVGVVGHFAPAHEGEKFKPTETMWLPCEAWDDVARENKQFIRRGAKMHALGSLLSSKWKDKVSGQERKQFRFRVLKFLEESVFQSLVGTVSAQFAAKDDRSLSAPSEFEDYPS